ncbi:MmcQ/YjbR family DNA-binding protein [Georgenia sp. MJ173]|uniref:MmcQ/YjbR family DNA-binding protein n=1 Tax=Georgenia sunbinii TaxID=3117728 RepID=UPI002F25F971
MAHPQMFDDADPFLARLRPIVLGFPDAVEVVAHGRPTFRVTKMFAVYGSSTTGGARQRVAYSRGLVVLPDEDDRTALEQDPRTFVPAYLAPAGWLGIDLEAGGAGPADVDWQEVAELLDASYRRIAGPRRVARLEAEGGPAGRGPATG